jgi:hypothetical protein
MKHHNSSTLVVGDDGNLYERIVSRQTDPDRVPSFPRRWPSPTLPNRNGPFPDQLNTIGIPRDRIQHTRATPPRLREDSNLVQSIEGSQKSPSDFRRSYPGQFPSSQNGGRVPNASGGLQDVFHLTDSSQQFPMKKRKLDDTLDDDYRGRSDHFNERFQVLRHPDDDYLAGPPHLTELRPQRSERVLTELPPQRFSHREFSDNAHPLKPAIVPRITNHAPENRDFPSTPLSTSYRAVELSSAPSQFPAFHDSAPVRAQRYAQSFRPSSPSRSSFTPMHTTDAQSVRRSYITSDREPIELVSDNRAPYDQRHVVNRVWPTEPVRSYPAERRVAQAEVLGRPIRDDQAIRPQTRQPIELVPISRTLSHDNQYLRPRREYLPVYDSPSAMPIRQPFDDLPESRHQRSETDYARVTTITSGDRRYDFESTQTSHL